MDVDADATPFGAWASVRGYFTPATLFLVLNLVIGTIALTSRSHQRRRRNREHQEPLDDPHQQQEQHEYHHYYQQPLQYVHATPPPPPAPLARTSSVLDRLRSISLYRFRSGDFPPECGAPGAAADHDAFAFAPVEEETTKQAAAHYARSGSEPAPAPAREEEEKRAPSSVKKSDTEVVRKTRVARAPATRVVVEADEAVDARAEELIASLRQEEPSSPTKTEHLYQEGYVPPPAPMRAPELSRTSSVLDRLRSLGLYSFLAAEATPATDGFAIASTGDEKQVHAHYYDRSRSEPPAREQGKKEEKQAASKAEMAKSSSTTWKAAATRLVEEDCVDARAEAFIDSFRKKQVRHDEDEQQERVVPPLLARTSSVLDRLRSFSLYLRSGADPVPDRNPVKASPADEKEHSEAARELQGKKKMKQGAVTRMSSEEAAARNVAGEEAAPPAEECVDARADDFINKFRQQLHLQRLNSLLNYREVLNRGGSKQ